MILFQSLVESLDDSNSEYAKLLCRSVCARIIERRQQTCKLRRYLEDFRYISTFDDSLARLAQRPVTLLERPTVLTELAKFVNVGGESSFLHDPRRERDVRNVKHDFELLVKAKRRTPTANLAKVEARECAALNKMGEAERILKTFERGKSGMKLEGGSLQQLIFTMDCTLPTSVPSERAFSRARKVKHYSRERLDDDRFRRLMFVRSMRRVQGQKAGSYSLSDGTVESSAVPEPVHSGEPEEEIPPC